MKSYLLGLLVAVVMSAIYVTNNADEISVNFLRFNTTFHQGIWEVFVFALGALIMWFFSVFASLETYYSNSKKTKELSKKIEELESEKKSLFAALENLGNKPKQAGQNLICGISGPEETDEMTVSKNAADEEPAQGKSSASLIKGFFSSIFKGGKKTGPETTEAAVIEAAPDEPGENAGEKQKEREEKETFTI